MTDPRVADSPWVTVEEHVRFCAGAPLVDAEGESLGALCVMDREPRSLSEEQRSGSVEKVRSVMSREVETSLTFHFRLDNNNERLLDRL
jgi:GAF domain-containing protein